MNGTKCDKQTSVHIMKPVIQAAIITLAFYAIEIAWVYLNIFPDRNTLMIADIILRIICGTVGLIILHGYSKCGESKCSLKKLFTNKVNWKTWLILIPFIIYILSPFLNLITADPIPADALTTEYIFSFSILIVQQFAVGFYENSIQRGLLMNGLIKHHTYTARQRLFTVFAAGLFFGLGHLPNIAFGENPLIQVPSTMMWGIFIAAVYMLSDNLLLVMLLHAFSDITPRIMGWMFVYAREGSLYQFVDCFSAAMKYVILPLTAIYICIRFVQLRKSETAID